MNAETTVGPVGKASGWSMLWGILMFVCGILAISLPLANSVRWNFASDLCLSFSQRRRIPLAGPARSDLWSCRNLHADESAFRRPLAYSSSGGFSSRRRNSGVGSLLPYPPGQESRVGFIRRHRYADSWDFNLDALAIECRLGDRNFGGNQLDLQWYLKVYACNGCSEYKSSLSVIHV
jgi:hypothetical protein